MYLKLEGEFGLGNIFLAEALSRCGIWHYTTKMKDIICTNAPLISGFDPLPVIFLTFKQNQDAQ